MRASTVEMPVRVLKVEASPQLRSALPAHKDGVLTVLFSPDGTTLATAGTAGEVALWDVARRERKADLPPEGQVYGMAFTPDGKTLLVSSHEPTDSAGKILRPPYGGSAVKELRGGVRLCDVGSGKVVGWLRRDKPRAVSRVHVSTDGKTAIVQEYVRGEKDGPNKVITALWDLNTRKPVGELPGDDLLYGVSPDGKRLVRMKEKAAVWDLPSGKEGAALTERGEHPGVCRFSPDGKVIAGVLYAGDGMQIALWDAASGKRLKHLPVHAGNVRALAFSPDGARLAVANGTRSRDIEPCDVEVRDVKSGHKLLTLRGHVNDVITVDFHPDGKLLATGGSDGTVRLWELVPAASARR